MTAMNGRCVKAVQSINGIVSYTHGRDILYFVHNTAQRFAEGVTYCRVPKNIFSENKRDGQ